MTRFARAKGSKASNERVPEDATSWSEMKQQLLMKNKEIEDNKKREEVINQRNANYKQFLEEKEKTESEKTSWANFPDASNLENKKLKGRAKSQFEGSLKQQNVKSKSSKVNQVLNNANNDSDSDAPPEEETAKKEIIKPIIKKKKPKQKKKLKLGIDEKGETKLIQTKTESVSKLEKKRKGCDDEIKVNKKIKENDNENKNGINSNEKLQKFPKDGTQTTKIVKENLTEKDLKKIQKKKERRLKQVEKKKRVKAELRAQTEEMKNKQECNDSEITHDNSRQGFLNSGMKQFKKSNPSTFQSPRAPHIQNRKPNIRDDEHSRKKPFLPNKMFINGKELEIDYVDGFPVKKEDAERLKNLRKEMISKGLPRSEINFVLRLQRRKAEKAFAREKKRVCFNCRTSGHNLSECPELNKNQVVQTAGSGICFKCGSTEHTHFECRVVRGQDFKFAQCFICNEQGHIARQCPDNARGLYPKGGACRVCGDVTHLKKDCPKYQEQQQQQEGILKIETLGETNPDVLENNGDINKFINNKRSNKIVKF